MKAILATVYGAVQGVGFRYSARRAAQRLGLVGHVRNLPSGAVEVWAQGPADAIEELRAFLQQGPPGSVVTSVNVVDVDPDATMVGFEITL